MKIPVEVSARHIHLSKNDLEKLFGKGYNLKKIKQLTQPSDFACEEVLNIKNKDKIISAVRIVGPAREKTQVEISLTDAKQLGANPPLRISGDTYETPGITLIGPAGEIELKEGLIIARRHIHCAPDEAKKLKLKDGDIVSVKIDGQRPVTFHDILVRLRDNYKFCLHLDTDEGNAAGISKKTEGIIL